MEASKLKNMVILKNLPSNLVEEAIVILKSTAKVRDLQKVENNKKGKKEIIERKGNDYVLKEAEMIVSKYITQIEEEKNKKETNKKQENKKYKRLKNYAYLSSFIVFLQTLMLLSK